MTLGDLGYTK